MTLTRALLPFAALSFAAACADVPSAPPADAVVPSLGVGDPPPPPITGKVSGTFTLSTPDDDDVVPAPRLADDGSIRIANYEGPPISPPTSVTFSVTSRYLNNKPNTLSWIKTIQDVSDVPQTIRYNYLIGNGRGEVRQSVEWVKGQGVIFQFDAAGNLWTIALEQFTANRSDEKVPLFTRIDDCLQVPGMTCAALGRPVVAQAYPLIGHTPRGVPIFGDPITSEPALLVYQEDVVWEPVP